MDFKITRSQSEPRGASRQSTGRVIPVSADMPGADTACSDGANDVWSDGSEPSDFLAYDAADYWGAGDGYGGYCDDCGGDYNDYYHDYYS